MKKYGRLKWHQSHKKRQVKNVRKQKCEEKRKKKMSKDAWYKYGNIIIYTVTSEDVEK